MEYKKSICNSQRLITLIVICTIFLSGCSHKNITPLKFGHIETVKGAIYPRIGPEAVLLNDGNVLICGGTILKKPPKREKNKLFPCEMYDPQKKKFVVTGRKNKPGAACTMTLLRDGRVLFTGGSISRTVEIYDPKTENFSVVGELLYSRQDHSATLLPDGSVLLVGGQFKEGYAELYFPETNSSLVLKDSTYSRVSQHQSILLENGNVFLGCGVTDAPRLFNWKERKFSNIKPLNIKFGYHCSITALSDGNLLITGGFENGFRRKSKKSYIYNTNTNTIVPSGSMNIGRAAHKSVLLQNGLVLIVGGHFERSIEIFDPKTQKFKLIGKMPHYRALEVIAIENGDVLFIGDNASSKNLNSIDKFVYKN